ncbi:MAG: hypothetical protein ACC628_02360 [Pirellulaceae bacterium]
MTHVVLDKMPGKLLAPGESAGELCAGMAKTLGLRPGIPVSVAIIDAHAGVPGAGAADPGTLVMVLGTSSCHMLNSTEDQYVPGVAEKAGQVRFLTRCFLFGRRGGRNVDPTPVSEPVPLFSPFSGGGLAFDQGRRPWYF